ncbi:MAG: protein kinase [Myxococcota bacterium]
MAWIFRSLVLTAALTCAGASVALRSLAISEDGLHTTARRLLAERLGAERGDATLEALAKLGAGPAPLAGVALGALGAVFALWPRRRRISRPSRGEGRAQASGRSPLRAEGEKLSRKDMRRVLRQAKERESADGPEAAAEILLHNGLSEEAFERFVSVSQWVRAAEIRHDQNRFEEAAELYERAGRAESAGAIWARLERHGDAARCYEKAGRRSVAGEFYEKVSCHRDAGRCFAAVGFHHHAAQAFLEAGAESEAARELLAAFDDEGPGTSTENRSRQKELRSIAKRGSELFERLGQLDQAEQLLVRAGLLAEAAEVALRAEAFERAAELFLRVGRGDLAADALERAGDPVLAARHRGEFLRDQGEIERAVPLLEKAGEFAEAGDLYRRLEQFERAGGCYENAGDYQAAAEMFRTANLSERAAKAYERASEPGMAAQCYADLGDRAKQAQLLEAAGRIFEAGKTFAELDRPDDAIRLLQRIDPQDSGFAEACSTLGKIFAKKGMHSLSIQKLEQATGGRPLDRENVDANYELALAQQAAGQLPEAIALFEQILGFDYHYRDVAERLEEAKRATQSAPSLPPAASEGRYVIDRELGRGGMGVVYLARDAVLDREVAYKVLPEQLRGNPNALRNFLREAKAAAQLNHPHIVTVYDAGESEHGFYLAMEYVDGTTLKEVLQRRGPLAVGGLLYVLRQMADGLAYAHSRKVVHRDIKTANTMWTLSRQVKIMDFGLAKLMEEVRNATTLISGTPFYMSPEQTLGRNVDHRTDLYSLGVTLFELATGELPFRKGNVPYHHVHTRPPDPRTLRKDLPEPLAALIFRCLEKDPAARFSTAGELRLAAEEIRRGLSEASGPPTGGKASA